MLTVNIIIFIPFIIAVLVPFVYRKLTNIHIGWFVMLVPATLFIILSRYIPSVASGKTYASTIKWLPTYGINFTVYLDGLSLIFGLLITGIGTLVILYSIYYLSAKESLRHFYIYLLLFMGSMLGVVLSDNVLVLYVFWELTSISSFLLIAFWYHRKRSREGAQKSLLITVTGGFAMLASFIMLSVMTDTFSIREIISTIGEQTNHSLFIPAMLLLLFGAFTKSAQFPFHIWLPDAMEAPTPVSAYLHSATMVKAGIYIVARFTPIFAGDGLWFWSVCGVGLLTLLWGSFNAVRQTDLKALLAYSTVSQLGMIMTMLGIGSVALHFGYSTSSVIYTQAVFAALFHLINHSTFKGALFMVVGIIDHEVGTRDIRRLGGLATFMPFTFTFALIGSFSMAGLPPFNGFLSKEMFFSTVLNIKGLNLFSLDSWGTMLPVIAWIASMFTFIYCMIIVFQTFFGPYKEVKLERAANEAPFGMLLAPGILSLLVIGIFLFPNILGKYILTPAMSSVFPAFSNADLGVEILAWHGFNTELWMTIGIIVGGTLLYITLRYWRGIYRLFPETRSFNTLYHYALEQLEDQSKLVTNYYMTGYLRDYIVYILSFFVVAISGTFFYTGAFSFTLSGNSPVTLYEWIIVIVMTVAAIAILFAKSRLTAILLNSVLGFAIAVFFVIFLAPDLALTQIVVETVTTVLFLSCYYFLPEWKKEDTPKRAKRTNAIIAVAVGALFTVVALAAQSEKLFSLISSYFEQAYELAGGKNIVNTILGDFRAFDTMLEIIVLLIAGVGVYTLIKLKVRREKSKLEN